MIFIPLKPTIYETPAATVPERQKNAVISAPVSHPPELEIRNIE